MIIKMQKNGFSLVELLIVISIIGVILSIGLLNYPAMRQQLALNRAAHQLVQEIRRAQGMAMSATELKEGDCSFSSLPLQFAFVSNDSLIKSNPSIVLADILAQVRLLNEQLILGETPVPSKGYGIYINLSNPDGAKSYKLYADTMGDNSADCQYPNTPPCWEYYNSGDCIYKNISIEEKGIIIKEINNIDVGSTGTGGIQKVSINFRPPNPDTNIKWLAPGADGVEIVLAIESDPDDSSKQKTVAVNRAGLIEVKK